VLRWLYSFVDEPEEIVRVLMLLVAAILIFVGFRYSNNGIIKTYLEDFNANLGTEIISILITIFVLDRLQSRSAEATEKKALILQMGSPDNAFAVEAVRQLRAKGWLKDGSLSSADLSDANLYEAKLNGANLYEAKLNDAKLNGAYLRGAYLRQTYLIDADLRFADLRGADLRGAILVGTGLGAAKYNHSTGWPDGFDPVAARAILVDDNGNPIPPTTNQ